MNLITQFVRIMHYVFKEFIFHIYDQFLNDIEMKELKIDYEEVETLSNIWWFMFKHIQNIDKILNDVEHTEITVAEEKS